VAEAAVKAAAVRSIATPSSTEIAGLGKIVGFSMQMVLGEVATATQEYPIALCQQFRIDSRRCSRSRSRSSRIGMEIAGDYSSEPDEPEDEGPGTKPGALLNLLTAATKPAKRKKKQKKLKGKLWVAKLVELGNSSNSASSDGTGSSKVTCLGEIHSSGVSGWDTDSSRMVTTNGQNMIPSLLGKSPDATQSISFESAAGKNRIIGIGPGSRATVETEDGTPRAMCSIPHHT
jgi:hypothetical protein